MKTGNRIKRGMALAFFASAYADMADECGQSLSGEIMDQLPPDIDASALDAADTLACDMSRANWSGERLPNLASIFEYASRQNVSGADRELSPELFGHYCAMQSMGHGVGLESFGEGVRDAIVVPYVEFGSHSLERDYFIDKTEVTE